MSKLSTNSEDFYKDLVIKILSDSITSEEAALLKDWIAKDQKNQAYFDQMKNAWFVTSLGENTKRFNSTEVWNKAKKKFDKQKNIPKFHYKKVLKIAAVVILSFSVGALATYSGFKKPIKAALAAQNNTNMVIAPLGSKSELILPDGTKVWLNAGSKLSYSQTFNSTGRDVYLEGEAFFKVKTNPQKPFVVRTSEISVKAYGTEFNVKAYPEENTITTTLVEGNVKIQSIENKNRKFLISLKPNQKLTYIKMPVVSNTPSDQVYNNANQTSSKGTNSKEATPRLLLDKSVVTNLYTSWKDERWIIERENLDKFTVKLERRYDVKFVYKSETLKKYKISGIISKETLEQVLDLLKLTVPLKYSIKEGIVTLDLDNARMDNYLKVMH